MTELQGPVVPEKERLMIQAYQHVFKDEWFDAIAVFEELLSLKDCGESDFLSSYATCLMNVGRVREAAEGFERALELRPEKRLIFENIIVARDHCEDTTIEQAYGLRRNAWGQHFSKLWEKQPHFNDKDPERPLRIGYVSGDFRSHSANMSFGNVVLRHSPAVQVYCYFNAHPTLWDEFTTIYSQEATLRMIDGIGDETVAGLIRRDKIDILVDLGSYSNGGRLTLFAMKPAPVQVTAWGYILGTGLDTIDVIFGDPVAMPYANQEYYSEKIVHLPSIIPFFGRIQAPDPSVLPCIKNKTFTFGCFNRVAKIQDQTLTMWSKVLKTVQNSQLILKETHIVHKYHRDRILKALDVNPNRVIFQGQTPHLAHLGAYNQIDLALDPFPIAGGVSMLEGMWQGVPALVRRDPAQKRVCSLVGVSAMTTLGMKDFIADSEEDYVRLAMAWATQGREALSQWRLNLRKLMVNSTLIQGYVEAVEDAYRDLWREWCKKDEVAGISDGGMWS